MKKILFIVSISFCTIANAQYNILFNLSGTTTGNTPFGSLTLSGSVLYGMTSGGGANNKGNIFSIHNDGTVFTDLLDFNGTNGNQYGLEWNSLTLDGNVLYGMTKTGGTNDDGVIFSIHTDGTNYIKLHDFDNTNGGSPTGSLTLSNNILYGMAGVGGANNAGCIFSIHTDGTVFTDLFDFNNTNGSSPNGSLTLSNNILYGMAGGGGNYDGVIFSIHTDGTNYIKLHDFDNTNGGNPIGDLTLSGNVLYGMTNQGGANGGNGGDGVIFSINTDGTNYIKLHDFNGTNGKSPNGSLTLSGNVLYGMTWGVSAFTSMGNIFSIH